MNKLTEKSRRLLRIIFKGLGVTAAAFTIHNCDVYYYDTPEYGVPVPPEYGVPPCYREDILIQGCVKSKKTDEPVFGISIWIKDITAVSAYLTDEEGKFYIYVPKQDSYTIVFTDVDGIENGGLYGQHTITITGEEAKKLKNTPLVIELDEIET